MCRTFSKIYGLAAVRLGWLYGPAHVVDALNRIRGPFNVNTPAMRAGVAAIKDTAHVENVRVAHNAKWLPWLSEEIGKLGLKVTPSVANFVLIHFPRRQGQDRQGCRRVPDRTRPDPARASAPTGLPNALRMTVGSEEANRLVVKALSDFMGRAA